MAAPSSASRRFFDVAVGLLMGAAGLGLAVLAARTWHWPELWYYTLANSLGSLPVMMYLDKHNPGLYAERRRFILNAGTPWWDKVACCLLVACFPLLFIGAGLDMRVHIWRQRMLGETGGPFFPVVGTMNMAMVHGGSMVPGTAVQQVLRRYTGWGAVLCLLGFWLGARAMCVNRWFSSVVRLQKERGHQVCSSGPYRFMRHPGYTGAIAWAFGTALVLASPRALWVAGVWTAVLLIRTALEDRKLQAELPGYSQYAQKVRYWLVPYLW